MRRAPVRGWWALPVAAGLTILGPAPAQPPGPSLGSKAGQPAAPRSLPPAPADEEATRLTEINVGLGWLADPLTFPCQLAAHVQAGTLEIRGFVPNEAVRARAVKVARERSGLNVISHLKLRPSAAPVWRRPPEELHAAALLALKKGFPKLAPGISVLCRPFGQVILTGHVESMEEKLALSQALRRLPGCSSVLNQLAVEFTTTTAGAAAHKAGPTAALAAKAPPVPAPAPQGASAQGPVLPRPQVVQGPALPRPQMVQGPALPRPQLVQSPALPRPQAESPYSAFATSASKGASPAGPELPDMQAASPYGPMSKPVKGVQSERKADAPVASAEGTAAPSPYAASTLSPPAAPKSYGANAPPVPPRSKAYAASWVSAPPAPMPPAPLPLPPALTTGPVKAAQAPPVATLPTPPAASPGKAAAPPSGWTAAKAPSPPVASQVVQTSYRPEGVPKLNQSPAQVAMTSPPPATLTTGVQAVKSAPAPTVVARASVPPPGEPYMARGLLILGDVAATPAARPADPWAQRQALLKHAIVATCGPAVHDVEVELRSSAEALIRFRAASKAEADRIWSDIQRVPELAPYKLDAVVKTP